jgi:hypothetical protein
VRTLLESFPRTIPSNYKVKGLELYEEGPAGFSLNDEAWAKADRQSDPNYDWYGYQQAIMNPIFDHPVLAHREANAALVVQWNDVLKELEPFNPRRA